MFRLLVAANALAGAAKRAQAAAKQEAAAAADDDAELAALSAAYARQLARKAVHYWP